MVVIIDHGCWQRRRFVLLLKNYYFDVQDSNSIAGAVVKFPSTARKLIITYGARGVGAGGGNFPSIID